jgi:hypothetical protein
LTHIRVIITLDTLKRDLYTQSAILISTLRV